MEHLNRKLNIRYGAMHGSYWMYYAMVISFSSVFLLDRGFDSSQIGIILGLGNALAVILQPLLADILDRTSKFTVFGLMEVLTILIALNTVALYALREKSLLLAGLFVTALGLYLVIQPFCNGASGVLEQTGAIIHFGACRGMGSLNFSIMIFFLGDIVEERGVNILMILGLIIMIVFGFVIWETSKTWKTIMKAQGKEITQKQEQQKEEMITTAMFAKRHTFFIICGLGVIFIYFVNSSLNTYMTQITYNIGGDSGDVGHIFSFLVVTEVPMLIFFDRFSKRFKLTTLLKFSSVVFILWIGSCLIARTVPMLIAAQIFSPISFAIFLPSMVKFIENTMSSQEAMRGQALFTTMTTVAGIFASVAGGFILKAGGATTLLIIGTVSAVIGTVIIFLFIEKAQREGLATKAQ